MYKDLSSQGAPLERFSRNDNQSKSRYFERSREIFYSDSRSFCTLNKTCIMERGGCIYIMTNFLRTTLYIGVTSDLRLRIIQHQDKLDPKSFTAKYNLSICIYYEMYSSIEEAIAREKQLKNWNRLKKENLIATLNKEWKDLSPEILLW